MNEEAFVKSLAAQTALVSAVLTVLLKNDLIKADDVIREIDATINKSVDHSGRDTAALRHMRSIMMKLSRTDR